MRYTENYVTCDRLFKVMTSRKKILILLTERFPFGVGETFLESEANYWSDFDRVILFPTSHGGTNTPRPFDGYSSSNVEIFTAPAACLSKPQKALALIKLLFWKEFWYELFQIGQKSKSKFLSIRKMISVGVNGELSASAFYRYYYDMLQGDNIILYAYWLYNPAVVASKLNEKIHADIAISRAHGFDLYESRSNGYLPFRRYLLSTLDKVYPVSNDGCSYLKRKYPAFERKIIEKKLGTVDYGIEYYERKSGKFRIVTCSNCVSIKRIDLIVEALSLFEDDMIDLEWTHYGDGPELAMLKDVAEKKLKGIVDYRFAGNLHKMELIDSYKTNQYDLFINVSSTEGIPVSIMEAMSFGIPVIATDVGGTSELVADKNFLLPADITATELKNKISEIINLDESIYLEIREKARSNWKKVWNANDNFAEFYRSIKES